ncbi:MAG: hypothetical protein OXG96_00790 [Acidobacteria bacterium]|nr:hypothetical protein [Acidobacteriota bacterium]
MKRYKARVLELYAQIHASHTPAQRHGKRRDLVDDLMELHQSDSLWQQIERLKTRRKQLLTEMFKTAETVLQEIVAKAPLAVGSH